MTCWLLRSFKSAYQITFITFIIFSSMFISFNLVLQPWMPCLITTTPSSWICDFCILLTSRISLAEFNVSSGKWASLCRISMRDLAACSNSRLRLSSHRLANFFRWSSSWQSICVQAVRSSSAERMLSETEYQMLFFPRLYLSLYHRWYRKRSCSSWILRSLSRLKCASSSLVRKGSGRAGNSMGKRRGSDRGVTFGSSLLPPFCSILKPQMLLPEMCWMNSRSAVKSKECTGTHSSLSKRYPLRTSKVSWQQSMPSSEKPNHLRWLLAFKGSIVSRSIVTVSGVMRQILTLSAWHRHRGRALWNVTASVSSYASKATNLRSKQKVCNSLPEQSRILTASEEQTATQQLPIATAWMLSHLNSHPSWPSLR